MHVIYSSTHAMHTHLLELKVAMLQAINGLIVQLRIEVLTHFNTCLYVVMHACNSLRKIMLQLLRQQNLCTNMAYHKSKHGVCHYDQFTSVI